MLIRSLLVLLLATSASAQTLSGGSASGASFGSSSGGGSPPGTLFNDATLNIFDTYDPLCDPDTAVANGIVFCDGFEDGTWIPDGKGETADADTDYWKGDAFHGDDVRGLDYALCNNGTIDPDKADFGARGTPCTGTQGWSTGTQGRNAAHFMKLVSGNPNSGTPLTNFSTRVCFKLVGETAPTVPGVCTWPSCDAFDFLVSADNPPKAFEYGDNRETGGISWYNVGDFGTAGTLVAGISSCGGEANTFNQSCNSSFAAGNCGQTPGSSHDYYAHKDEWQCYEFHWNANNGAGNDSIEWWGDNCGRDGLSCPETPTKRMDWTGLDLTSLESYCSTPDSFWVNWWQNSPMQGEIQVDELVVRDWSINPTPIGY